jgi:hypothetical protein
MSFGVDYAFNPHPPVAALKTAGCVFVARYTSALPANDSNGKNLLKPELKTLLAAGLKVVVVAEEGATRMKGGHSAGVTDATHADAVVKALGMPTIPVYFACDYDAPQSDQSAINAYLDGCASVMGDDRGRNIYGGFWPTSRARAAGKAVRVWGTIAWSGSNWVDANWQPQIMQGLTVSVGGVQVDVDHSHGTDYGQWPRPAAPTPPPPAGTGPFRKEFTGLNSWVSVANARGTTAAQLMELSATSYTDADKAKLAALRPRRGTPYYTKNR